jgi:hypothetical protein
MPAGSTAKSAHNSTGRNPYAVRTPNGRSKLTNGTRGIVLPGKVDQRSAIARRYRDVIAAIASDLGGAANTTETKLHLVRRFAALVVQAEAMEARLAEGKPIDVSAHAHISSTLVRLAARIGLKRAARDITPTLAEILRGDDEADAS